MLDYWFQPEAVDSIFHYFEHKNGYPLVAMPTGTGKSHVQANFIKRVIQQWPNQRFMCLTHVKELLVQNSERMAKAWPLAPIGIYSAGLKQRDTAMPIIFGGVASVHKNITAFGHRDLVLIDECHLVAPNDNTMYQQVIGGLKEINPYLKVIGFSATPWRMGQGLITDDGLFTDICYDLTSYEMFNRLIAEGYLCPPIPKITTAVIDTSDVRVSSTGDFQSEALEHQTDKVLYQALEELVSKAKNRNSWLIFTSGVKTSDHAAQILSQFGVNCESVHSKHTDAHNDKAIRDFKSGKLRAICNYGKLTTGFDYPAIDCIGMLRATMSPGLWVQMLGRGTRPSPETGKTDCLVLDFARNAERLGPINDPRIPRRKGSKSGDMPVKLCDACGAYNHARATICCSCGYDFPTHAPHGTVAAETPLIRDEAPITEYFDVFRVTYAKHMKEGSAPSIKVTYMCGALGMQRFNEWVALEAPGYGRKRAKEWWIQRHYTEPPETTDAALHYISGLRAPKRIRVWVNKKPFPEVLGAEF